MIVDLARNDLSRHCSNVVVEKLKEVQYYSHVIHLVSKVVGKLPPNTSPLQVVGDTFPAGTLSGAPKYRAMQLIDQYEPVRRQFYGGCIGYLGFDGTVLLAIMIRTILAQKNLLTYQAGMGVVYDSDPQKEVEEVNAKVGALRKSIFNAGNL